MSGCLRFIQRQWAGAPRDGWWICEGVRLRIDLALFSSAAILSRMERIDSAEAPTFSARLGMAFRLVFNAGFARDVNAGLKLLASKNASTGPVQSAPRALAPEKVHASGLLVLSALQREGRLIDFLQQDVAGFSDQDVGAAARVVHAGCNKVLQQYFTFEPAAKGDEGTPMTLPQGFDAHRIRLTGNVTGQPPFRGTLKHHGWIAKEVRLPALPEGLDPRVVAPAEVELP